MELRNKGNADLAMNIAMSAIVLVVVVVVIAVITTNVGTGAGLTGAGLAAYNNVTSYTWLAIQLSAVGLVLLGGLGLVYMLGRRK